MKDELFEVALERESKAAALLEERALQELRIADASDYTVVALYSKNMSQYAKYTAQVNQAIRRIEILEQALFDIAVSPTLVNFIVGLTGDYQAALVAAQGFTDSLLETHFPVFAPYKAHYVITNHPIEPPCNTHFFQLGDGWGVDYIYYPNSNYCYLSLIEPIKRNSVAG